MIHPVLTLLLIMCAAHGLVGFGVQQQEQNHLAGGEAADPRSEDVAVTRGGETERIRTLTAHDGRTVVSRNNRAPATNDAFGHVMEDAHAMPLAGVRRNGR